MQVCVLGASGRMGLVACRAVLAAGDLELATVVAGSTHRGAELRTLLPEAPVGLRLRGIDAVGEVDVVVDFSTPAALGEAAELALPAGVHLVSGTTGVDAAGLARLGELAAVGTGHAVWAPNFALGAVLAGHFATVAARHFPAGEVIELHHPGKADAPSGTAIQTARAMAAAGCTTTSASVERLPGARGADVDEVRVHAIRLPGLIAHQEVVFGGDGEVLTIRHDSLDRQSYMPGMLLAVRAVAARPGLTSGLEPLLGLLP